MLIKSKKLSTLSQNKPGFQLVRKIQQDINIMNSILMTTVLSLLIFLMGAVRCQKPPYCSANKFEIDTSPCTCNGRYKELHCCVPSSKTIRWYRRGKLVEPSGRGHWLSENNRTLCIMHAGMEYAGQWKCAVEDQSSIKTEYSLNLQIEECPQPSKPHLITPKSHQTIRKHVGENVKIMCSAIVELDGCNMNAMRERIRWVNPRTRMAYPVCSTHSQENTCVQLSTRNNGLISQTQLVINNVQLQHRGSYVCEINTIPTIQINTKLIVEG